MPTETVKLTISGANPQTKTVSIQVDPKSGSGTTTVAYTGTNGGQDTVSAAMTVTGTTSGTSNLSSNNAFISWQATNGVVSLINPANLTGYANADHETFYPIGASFFGPQGFNSIIVNQVDNNTPIHGITSPDGNSGEYKLVPPHVDTVNPDGTAQTPAGTALTSFGSRSFLGIYRGQIVVSQAGIQTLYFLVDDAWALYVGGGATRVQGTFNPNNGDGGGGTPSTFEGLPLLGCRNTAAANLQPTDYIYINFPKPGIYTFALWWKNNSSAQGYLQPTFAAGAAALPSPNGGGQFVIGGVIKPVGLQAAPSNTVPSGNLQLSVASGNQQIQGQQVTLTVSVSGIKYATKSYVPVLEGVAGTLNMFNDATNATYNFPMFGPNVVNKTAAAAAVFQITGDNNAWNGRFATGYDGTNFTLKYNGSALQGFVASTQLSISADDIAWFDPVKGFDLFTPSLQGGGNTFDIEVDYMPKPIVASVGPLSVSADGGNHTFQIRLDRPFTPQQQGAFTTGNTVNLPSVALSGCTIVGSPAPVLDGNGFLLGWNVTFTIPASAANGSSTMTIGVTGTLTYLSGPSFVTGTVTYIAAGSTIATISRVGQAFKAPVEYSFTGPTSTTVVGIVTLKATVYTTTNDPVVLTFYRKQSGTTNQVALTSALTPVSSSTGSVAGVGTVFFWNFQASVTSVGWYTSNLLGFIATDNTSGLSVTYFSGTVYTNGNTTIGGGTGGCPALEMFVSGQRTVESTIVGDTLDCLESDYKTVNQYQVEWLDHSDEECVHLVAENGAEVIVSVSTPVPTREAHEAMAAGADAKDIPCYANELKAGMHVLTDVGNGVEWSLLTETCNVGVRKVARLYVGGRNFAAGRDPRLRIFTHNVLAFSIK